MIPWLIDSPISRLVTKQFVTRSLRSIEFSVSKWLKFTQFGYFVLWVTHSEFHSINPYMWHKWSTFKLSILFLETILNWLSINWPAMTSWLFHYFCNNAPKALTMTLEVLNLIYLIHKAPSKEKVQIKLLLHFLNYNLNHEVNFILMSLKLHST